MATVMGTIGNGLYAAFYEPDENKRREALLSWVKSATPAIQAAVEGELMALVELVCQGRWTQAGWKEGEKKLHGIQNDYPLVMDIKLRKINLGEKYLGQLPDKVAYEPPAPSTGVSVKETQAKRSAANAVSDDDGGDDDSDEGGHSPNDDRSDSMNPNNDACQAANDNRSDQMNPNNDSYWSSRGR